LKEGKSDPDFRSYKEKKLYLQYPMISDVSGNRKRKIRCLVPTHNIKKNTLCLLLDATGKSREIRCLFPLIQAKQNATHDLNYPLLPEMKGVKKDLGFPEYK
jgi:hypothetical protein